MAQLKTVPLAVLVVVSLVGAGQARQIEILSSDALNLEEERMSHCGNLEVEQYRERRKVANFTAGFKRKWNVSIIPYEIDTAFTSGKTQRIEDAFAEWESKTCLRFLKYENASSQPNYIYVRDGSGCSSSNVGMASAGGQNVNLKSGSCFGKMEGRLVHEIGHALGMFHEHVRPDAASYVTPNSSNIQSGAQGYYNILLPGKIDTHDVPYDLSSVMHYGPKDWDIDSDYYTLTTVDSLYQRNLGNLDEITFFDAQAMNRAMCDTCNSSITCEKGGYPDPTDPDNDSCDKCICQDAFSGDLCDSVKAASGPTTCPQNGQVNVTSTTWSCISFGPYSYGTSCNWLLKSDDAEGTLDFEFDSTKAYDMDCGGFSMGYPCRHYTEVRYKDLHTRGPRFCCDDRPTMTLTSDTHEIVVTFRSVRQLSGTKDGFGMCFRKTP